jgi:hypothetical protein
VAGDGRLAVGYYDFRHNDGAGEDTETDYFVGQCAEPDPTEPDLCAGEWAETRVTAQSFDLSKAPTVRGSLFLGDYVGLTDVPGAFGTAFTVSSSADPATIHYSTVPFTTMMEAASPDRLGAMFHKFAEALMARLLLGPSDLIGSRHSWWRSRMALARSP